VSDEPPSPTQNAADAVDALSHVVTGTVHVPVTLENWSPAAFASCSV